MINPEKYEYYKSLGYTQEFHRIPMYRIMFSIKYLREHNRLATSNRIADLICKKTTYVSSLLDAYTKYTFVNRKLVRTQKNKKRRADSCVWHWVISARGEEILIKLREQFGDMIITDEQNQN